MQKKDTDSKTTHASRVLQSYITTVPLEKWTVAYLGRAIFIGKARIAEGARKSSDWVVHDLTAWGLSGQEREIQVKINDF